MNLSELRTGEKAVIAKVHGHGSFRKRLIEMGFISGKRVYVVQNAPLMDPIEYEILGYRVSIRRGEAKMIEVISEDEAMKHIATEHAAETIYADEGDEEDLLNREMRELALKRNKEIRVALVGNPNCGKTSLFNLASGSHEHTGNYSGVTVDAKEGRFSYKGYQFVFVDLPGTYSLSAYSPEELYVRKNLIDTPPDVVINVVDASNLERNLYLTTQLIDMNLKVVMALNMFDELEARGDRLEKEQLEKLFGMPVCPTVCRDGTGLEKLLDTVVSIYRRPAATPARHIHVNHGRELEKSIDRIKLLIQKNSDIRSMYSTRYLAIKSLEDDGGIAAVISSLKNSEEIGQALREEKERILSLTGTNTESAIVDAKYAFIHGALTETYFPGRDGGRGETLSDRIDRIVTDRWLAFPIFIFILYLIFQATFSLGEYPLRWIESLVGAAGGLAGGLLPEGWARDMLTDGIIGGVGSVLVFLPNIMILYLFISLMEDSGYMSRAAFIVDKMMHKIGLHGKSFIPMVMGFGCNVPAIMATRAIESRKSRLMTIAIIPFMSCSGRLPVFVLLAGAFFPGHGAIALLGIYLLGVLVAIFSSLMLRRFIHEDDLPFVMELPPYRIPTGRAIWRHTWEKGRQYLQKMSTTILVGSLVIWCLGYFPLHRGMSEEYRHENSYIAAVGKSVAPVLDPLGFSWKMDVGLLTGVVAKELTVSTLGVMYSGSGPDGGTAGPGENPRSSDSALQKALEGSIPLPAAVAYMVFILLYFPCIATFSAVRSETGSWGWAAALCAYTMAVAWVMAFLAFRITGMFV